MKIYAVGGQVRDMLLGLTPKDKDWVVVGSSVEEMLSLGYQQVGKDFPVFICPETGDEYALARTEKKTGNGYTGFSMETDNVALEQDLLRRDLRINSMAIPQGGTINDLIDPWGGLMDIQTKTLQYTSEAFSEDPVRVLRIARFLARMGADWRISPATETLLHEMVQDGALKDLIVERIWKEVEKALDERFPTRFFYTLHQFDADEDLLPELYQGSPLHFTQRMSALRSGVMADLAPHQLWAIVTAHMEWNTIGDRLKIPNNFYRASADLNEDGVNIKNVLDLPNFQVHNIIKRLGGYSNNTQRIEDILETLKVISESQHGIKFFTRVYEKTLEVTAQESIMKGMKGADIGEDLERRRMKVIRKMQVAENKIWEDLF